MPPNTPTASSIVAFTKGYDTQGNLTFNAPTGFTAASDAQRIQQNGVNSPYYDFYTDAAGNRYQAFNDKGSFTDASWAANSPFSYLKLISGPAAAAAPAGETPFDAMTRTRDVALGAIPTGGSIFSPNVSASNFQTNYDPAAGPQVNAGNGPEPILSMNPPGQGFLTATAAQNQLNASTATLKNLQAPPSTPTPATPDGSSITTTPPPAVTFPTTSNASGVLNNAATSVDTTRQQLESAYQAQLNSVTQQKDAAQAQIDGITAKQNQTLDQIQSLSQPFQQALEDSERQRLQIEDNFFANQDLVNQLQGLLTSGQQQLQDANNVTGLSAIRNPRIDQMQTNLAGQVSVIQAVLAARNNQISVGEGLIDRSVAAITADKNDQLSYYKTLLDFYGTEKSTAEAQVSKLSDDQRTYLNAQIGLIETDLKNAQANSDAVKSLLTDPQTALLAARAGISLTDDPTTINRKLATVTYQDEVNKIVNTAASNGLTRLLTPQDITKAGANVITYVDSQGKQYYFSKPASASATSIQELPINGVNHKVLYDETTHQIVQDFGPSISSTSSADAEAATRLKAVTPAINAIKGTDGYVNPQAFMQLYQAYIQQNPGKGDEFLKNFPLEIYVNPKDRYLFSKTGA
jgi:hypothetical protein